MRRLAVFACGILILTLTGCGGKPSGREIALEVTSFQFTPAAVEVKAGEYEFECDMTGHEGMHIIVKVTN